MDCKRFLNLEIIGHRVSSKSFPLFINNMRFITWDLWKIYLFEIYGNIDDQNTSVQLSNNIINFDKDCSKRDIHDLIYFILLKRII